MVMYEPPCLLYSSFIQFLNTEKKNMPHACSIQMHWAFSSSYMHISFQYHVHIFFFSKESIMYIYMLGEIKILTHVVNFRNLNVLKIRNICIVIQLCNDTPLNRMNYSELLCYTWQAGQLYRITSSVPFTSFLLQLITIKL